MTNPQDRPPDRRGIFIPHLHLGIFGFVLSALIAAIIVISLTGPSTKTTTTAPVAPQQQAQIKAAAAAKAPLTTKQQDSLPCPPPPGEAVMGVCAPKPVQVFGSKAGAKIAPVGVDPPASIPDVSSWQGIVNWAAVKAWQVAHHFTPAGIFKMGEYVPDPYAARNNAQLRALGMWRAGYWFLRNTGCSHEASQIIAEAKFLGLTVVVLDDETPEARGYDGCLTPPLRAAGFIVAEYASPGAYPGGSHSSNPAWIAAYGPASPPLAPWGGPIKAFQCTDGVFGCVTYIPGVGKGDVSVDYGITQLGVTPKPVDPHEYSRFSGVWQKSPWGVIHERRIVEYYDNHYGQAKYHKAVLKDRAQLRWMAGQLTIIIRHSTAASNAVHFRQDRVAELRDRGENVKRCKTWSACA